MSSYHTTIDMKSEKAFAREFREALVSVQKADAQKIPRIKRIIREMGDIEGALPREHSKIAQGGYESADSPVLRDRLAVVQDDIENLRAHGREYKRLEGKLPLHYKRGLHLANFINDYFVGKIEGGVF